MWPFKTYKHVQYSWKAQKDSLNLIEQTVYFAFWSHAGEETMILAFLALALRSLNPLQLGLFIFFQCMGFFPQSFPNSLTLWLRFGLNFLPFLNPVQSISPFFCYPSQISSCCRVCRSRWVRETLWGSAFWIFSSNCWIGSVDLEGPVGSQDHLHKSSILLHWPRDPLYPPTLWWLHSSKAMLKEGFSCYDLFRDIILKLKVTEKLFPAQGK